MADKFCGPLSALIFHESLQGQQTSNSNQIYRTILKIIDIWNSSNKVKYQITYNSLSLSEIEANAVYMIQMISFQNQTGKTENEDCTSKMNLMFVLVLP